MTRMADVLLALNSELAAAQRDRLRELEAKLDAEADLRIAQLDRARLQADLDRSYAQLELSSEKVRSLELDTKVLAKGVLNEYAEESAGDEIDWEDKYLTEVSRNSELSVANFDLGVKITSLLSRIEFLEQVNADIGDNLRGERNRADEMTTARDVALEEMRSFKNLSIAQQQKISELLGQIDDRQLRSQAVHESGGDVTRARQLYDFMRGSSDISKSSGSVDPRPIRDNPQA